MKSLFDLSRNVAMAAAVGLLACAPAVATTISLTPQTYGYFDPTASNHFGPSPIGGSTAAQVGRVIDSDPYNGDYAATIEFLIPTLPSDATLTGLGLAVSSLGDTIGDVQLRSYFATNTAFDATRIFAGSNLTNYLNLNAQLVTTDLLGGPTVNYLEDNPGLYLGFSFRETNPRDPRYCSTNRCGSLRTLGFANDPAYPLPDLTISYDVVTPPPTSVPEPASLGMFIVGLGLMGGAMLQRQRQRRPVSFD